MKQTKRGKGKGSSQRGCVRWQLHLCSLGTSVMFLGLCCAALEMGRTKEGEVSRLAAACTFSSPSGKTCTWSMDSCISIRRSVLCVGQACIYLTDSCKSSTHLGSHLRRLAHGPWTAASASGGQCFVLGRLVYMFDRQLQKHYTFRFPSEKLCTWSMNSCKSTTCPVPRLGRLEHKLEAIHTFRSFIYLQLHASPSTPVKHDSCNTMTHSGFSL